MAMGWMTVIILMLDACLLLVNVQDDKLKKAKALPDTTKPHIRSEKKADADSVSSDKDKCIILPDEIDYTKMPE